MKGKAIVPLALGLLVGVFAVKMVFNAIQKAQAGNVQKNTIIAVRATQDIAPYQQITAEMVEAVETISSAMLPTMERVESVEEVVGRVTSKSIPQYAAVLQSMLAPVGTPAGMVGRIPEGYRAVAVRIDEASAVAYQIHPGDWVDVLVVMDISNSVTGRRDTVAEVVLQHVQVAAVGDTTTPAGKGGSSSRRARSVTLMVEEEDAPRLHLAATQGKIKLAMRGDDTSITKSPARAEASQLFARGRQAAVKKPAKPAGPDLAEMLKAMKAAAAARKPEPVVEQNPVMPFQTVVYHGSKGIESAATVERIIFADQYSSEIVDVAIGPPTRGSTFGRSNTRVKNRSQ
ncbi:MAG: Flp pilus assembly protein CpaB [Phycisphaerae bacterium]